MKMPTRSVRRFAALGATTMAMALGTGGTAAAQEAGDPLKGVNDLVNQALSTKEGCKYPGLLVIVVAQVSREEVEGCGYFETDPAHPGNQGE